MISLEGQDGESTTCAKSGENGKPKSFAELLKLIDLKNLNEEEKRNLMELMGDMSRPEQKGEGSFENKIGRGTSVLITSGW